ncbi:MAG: hypothetical protein H6841_05200 [Planctomycetes bacterium]|nr:hypothetical protein [Planctomycetota bacterium]MCB9935012.1 hypothetical protein [Planctomycetota bacterium]
MQLVALLISEPRLLPPLAASGGAPPPGFFAFPVAFFAMILGLNLLMMSGCGVIGWFIAKKYDIEPWLGALAGFFLNWMGVLIVFVIGYTQQQSRERRQREEAYAAWWYANYGPQRQPTPYAWPGGLDGGRGANQEGGSGDSPSSSSS